MCRIDRRNAISYKIRRCALAESVLVSFWNRSKRTSHDFVANDFGYFRPLSSFGNPMRPGAGSEVFMPAHISARLASRLGSVRLAWVFSGSRRRCHHFNPASIYTQVICLYPSGENSICAPLRKEVDLDLELGRSLGFRSGE